MMFDNEFLKRTIQIEKIFDAPIELVWEAWTNPIHIAKWWNPAGGDTEILKHEFKVGGDWKYLMKMPNGATFITRGSYIEIINQEKICSKANFPPVTENIEIQSLFKAVDDKTEFTFNIIHPTESYKIQQEKMGVQNGWGTVLNNLNNFLKLNK